MLSERKSPYPEWMYRMTDEMCRDLKTITRFIEELSKHGFEIREKECD